jgi:hypothetical protein
METKCPCCFKTYRGKLLNLLDIMADVPRYSIKGAVFMQKMSQYIEKSLECASKGKPGKEKKKPKKEKKEKK